jgi:hypothetical protein
VTPRSFITSLSSLLLAFALSLGCDIGTPGEPVGGDGDGDGDGDTGDGDGDGDDGGDDDDLPPQDLLALWSGCMTLDNWTESGMAEWALKTAEGGTVCSSCHDNGMENFDTNPEAEEMFRRNRLRPFVRGFFVQVSTEVLPAYDKIDLKASGQNNHPTYLTDDVHYENLESFYLLTKDLLDAGNCPETSYPL